MCKHVLHGPLDGLLKAVYSDRDAQLVIRYADIRCELDETDCDNLLRTIECSASDEDAIMNLAEFFEDEFGKSAGRVAIWFNGTAHQLAKLVYA